MRALLLIAVAACGRFAFDPLGDAGGDAADQTLRVASVILGGFHTCAVSNRNQVTCWGANTWGMLGVGDTNDRGGKPGELGAALPPIDLGSGVIVRSIVSRSDFTCALLSTEQVKCWGNNDGAQLGTGDWDSRGDDPGEMGDALPVVSLATATRVSGIATGHYHACVLIAGNVACWGKNDVGQNGYGNYAVIATSAELSTLPTIDLGPGVFVQAIESQFNATCVLTTDRRVKCWGYQADGQLGLGDNATRGGGPNEMGVALPFVDLGPGVVTTLASGFAHSCVLIDQRLKCWGINGRGGLGLGDVNNRGDDPGEMGTALPYVDLGNGAQVTAVAGPNGRGVEAGGMFGATLEGLKSALGHGQTVQQAAQQELLVRDVARQLNDGGPVDGSFMKSSLGGVYHTTPNGTTYYERGADGKPVAVPIDEFGGVDAAIARQQQLDHPPSEQSVLAKEPGYPQSEQSFLAKEPGYPQTEQSFRAQEPASPEHAPTEQSFRAQEPASPEHAPTEQSFRAHESGPIEHAPAIHGSAPPVPVLHMDQPAYRVQNTGPIHEQVIPAYTEQQLHAHDPVISHEKVDPVQAPETPAPSVDLAVPPPMDLGTPPPTIEPYAPPAFEPYTPPPAFDPQPYNGGLGEPTGLTVDTYNQNNFTGTSFDTTGGGAFDSGGGASSDAGSTMSSSSD